MTNQLSGTRPILCALAAGAALMVSGCVSLGVEPPERLLTLSSTAVAPAGSGASTGPENGAGTIAVMTPEVPAKLDVLRVPVNVSETEIAYLQDAFWVEKPARLFRRLLGETLRTRGAALVFDTDDAPVLASQSVRGTLLDMTYDAPSGSVIVRFEAIRSGADGRVVSRRFEAREEGVVAEPAFVGPALNRAANQVASEVAEWLIDGA